MTEEPELADRTVIVTGASSGIGKAMAERFGAAGANLVLCALPDDEIEAVAEGITETTPSEAVGVECDVTDMAAVRALVETTVERFGGVDTLLSNAGGMIEDDELHRIDEATFQKNLDVNLTGHFRVANAALPWLVDSGDGSVVFTGTVNALTGIGLTAYSAAKAGLLSLSRLLAVQYGQYGVRSNVISPGTILTKNRTDEFHDRDQHRTRDRTVREAWLGQYPLGRFGRPEEVAEAALFLGSGRSSFVSGTNLVVDGGFTAGRGQEFRAEIYDTHDRPTPDGT